MYRFLLRPKWIAFHVLVLVAIVVMVNLGFWQLRRLDQRQDFNAEVRRNEALPTVPIEELLPADADEPDPPSESLEWRQVSATGSYDAERELLVDQRSQGGLAGQVVLTPLILDDGRLLLVERGFVPLALGSRDAEVAPPPAGDVTVTGRLRVSEIRRTGGLTDADPGDDIVPRVDVAALTGPDGPLEGDAVPMFVELLESTPPQDGPYPQPLDGPTLSNGPHLGYAVQWFIFSACAAVGWVFAVRHSVRTRRKAASASGSVRAAPTESNEPTEPTGPSGEAAQGRQND